MFSTLGIWLMRDALGMASPNLMRKVKLTKEVTVLMPGTAGYLDSTAL